MNMYAVYGALHAHGALHAPKAQPPKSQAEEIVFINALT